MGFSRKRVGKDGRARYTAYYLDMRGHERSAGTFSNRKDADKAWQMTEATFAAGRPSDPRRGRMTFTTYLETIWFPNHVLEPSTRQSYRYLLDRHILPTFGPMRLSTILPMHVREWVTALSAAGVSPAMIRHNKIVLSAIFTTALNGLVIAVHPCKGVKSPTVPVKEYRILTPTEYDLLQTKLPPAAQLLVETAIDSGLRWGELTELRPCDVNVSSGVLTVSRAVVELQPQFHPSGGRFLVKPYPKGKRSRRFKLNAGLVLELKAHATTQRLGPDDLLFSYDLLSNDAPGPAPLASVDTLGLTEPNDRGRSYQHGTLSAYTAGRCRCPHCRGAFATYRSGRRAVGLDDPRGRRERDTDGHIPRDWFRRNIWTPACEAAGIDPPVRIHDLRHANASWLLAGGADLQVVKERLGHQSIVTSEKYLHTLPEADETALAAMDRIRKRGKPRAG
jgi:integrase